MSAELLLTPMGRHLLDMSAGGRGGEGGGGVGPLHCHYEEYVEAKK